MNRVVSQPSSPDLRRIALILSNHPIFDRIKYGLRRHALARRNWLFSIGENSPDFVRRLGFDALVGPFSRPAYYRRYRSLGVPMIALFGVRPTRRPLPHIEVDDEAVGRCAADYLWSLGYRHFGFVRYGDNLDFVRRRLLHPLNPHEDRRLAAFHRALRGRASSFTVSPRYNIVEFTYRQPLVDWLRRLPRPTALLAVDDTVGREIVETCRLEGLAVPEQIAVLGINDDVQTCTLAQPGLSSVVIPWETIGEQIGHLLDELFERGRLRAKTYRIGPTGITVRGSTAPVTTDELVARVLSAMRARSHEPGNLKELLDGFGVSRRHLERRFRLATGRTPLEELQRMRIEHAQEMLADTDLPDEDVAVASGFSSATHLRRVFRKVLGKPPRAFRHVLPSVRQLSSGNSEKPPV